MRAAGLPPVRNTTGPHRARHSVFRHPASMPDKAGVEVYRYARQPVDSPVCICPIRGAGNASAPSCCALYGYVSGCHAIRGPCWKIASGRADAQGATCDLPRDGRRRASCRNRDAWRGRRPRTTRPLDTRLRRPRYATRCVRIDRVADEDLGKCVVWPNRLRWQHVPACFSPRARSTGRDSVACETTWLHEMERKHGFPRRHPA